MKILVSLVNFGDEQLNFLKIVVESIKSFKKYSVDIVVNSNIPINIKGVDVVNVIHLEDFQLLPLTCRKVIWDNRNNYDVFIYGENDHLFLEKHIDKHLEYEKILPSRYITGLIQYETDGTDYYYPAYHKKFDWDYDSVKKIKGKTFAHFNNLHQATFILTKSQLLRVGKKINFNELVSEQKSSFRILFEKIMFRLFSKEYPAPDVYSVKCKVNTDIYKYGGLKKMICISEFEDNLIHHLPNLYIHGEHGRLKLRSENDKMQKALYRLLK